MPKKGKNKLKCDHGKEPMKVQFIIYAVTKSLPKI